MAQRPLDPTGQPSRFVGVKMTRAAFDRLDELAQAQRTTRSEVIRRLIEEADDSTLVTAP